MNNGEPRRYRISSGAKVKNCIVLFRITVWRGQYTLNFQVKGQIMKTRDKNFTVRLTQEEYNYLKTEAAKLYMTIGGYIRLKAIV